MPSKREAAMRAHGGGGRDRSAGSNSLSHVQYSAREPQRQYPKHGKLRADVWAKELSGSRHMLRVPPSWAVDLEDLAAAEHSGARACAIRDLETGRTFWAMLSTIRRRGFRLDRKAGEQVGLTLDHWRATRREAERDAITETPATLEPVRQGELW